MNRYEAGFARVQATPEFQKRLLNRLNDELLSPAPTKPVSIMTRQRKALLILIAAALLLLSACAAYAVYWSSTQRAKDYAQSEVAVDDRRTLAEQYADAAIAGMTFFSPLSGTAEVDGITFQPVGVCYYPNEKPPEVHLTFNSADSKTGDNSRLTDFDFVLTIGGIDYPAYAKADGTVRALPAIALADPSGLDADHEMWFRIDDQAIVSGMPIKLSGTLYQWDENGQRGENLESFSFDFVYEIPTEEIEAERARLVEQTYAELKEDARARSTALSQLPNEMTQLNIKQDEYTFTDAQATKDGFLFGYTWVTDGADGAEFYMDGYHCYTEPISNIFTPDTSRPRQDTAWEIAYFGTYETVTCYPWYAPIEELPETVLIAVLRDAGTKQRTKADINGYYEGEKITYTWNAVELLLRVNPRTGEITLPRDDTERKAWREETEKLALDGRNENSYCLLDSSESIGDVSITLSRLGITPLTHKLYVSYIINGLYCPPEVHYSIPYIFLDGVELQTDHKAGHYTAEAAKTWVESYGTFKPLKNWSSSSPGYNIPALIPYLSDSLTMQFVWDVYDRDKDYNRVFIGTFDITFEINKSDIKIGEAVS